MMKQTAIFVAIVTLFSYGCNPKFNPQQTYSPEQLSSDFGLMKQALLEGHPALYRYTSPDSINWIFDKTERQLNHAMTEREFRRTINPVISMVRCGHTDIHSSKGYQKYIKKHKPKDLPIGVSFVENKIFIDTNRSTDSTLKIGDEIVEIDGRPITLILNEMWSMMTSDGYNQTFKYTLTNLYFESYYRYLYSKSDSLNLKIKDSTDSIRNVLVATKKTKKVEAKKDAAIQKTLAKPPQISKADRKRTLRFSEKDSTLAMLDINTFSDNTYKSFYRKSFKKIVKKGSKNLVIDLRNNGGGQISACINLMSYLIDSSFVVLDSATTYAGRPSFNRHYQWRLPRWFSRTFFAKKMPNGQLLNRMSGRVFEPTKKYHFEGNTYVLTNGGTFSASAIFASIAQLNDKSVKIVGRESGGGRYGCNAFISPHVVLPHTQARLRLPMYRLLLHVPGKDNGRGIMPDYRVEIKFKDATKDADMAKVYELIGSK